MDKEDKQIIKRAVKEEWIIGDRTRLKRLLEKNLKQYRENVELENENRLLGERCNQLLKDKGELTDKIADIKANCDLAIEGRDLKIKELEQELTVEKDQHQEEINLHLHAEDYIKSLEKENAELRNNGFTVSAMTEQQLKVALKKGEQLEKENAKLKKKLKEKLKTIADKDLSFVAKFDALESENAELKEKNKWYSEQVCNKECAEVWGNLTKAKEHIQTLISCLIDWVQEGDKDYCYIADAEQFLKECK